MIRDINIPLFLRRTSDRVIEGRNRTRINLGTDRKRGPESGFGDGGKNDVDSGTIDIVAGYQEEHPNYKRDKSRLYISGKTSPDEYFGLERGPNTKGEAAAVLASENTYIIGRKKIKIIIPNTAAILIEEGRLSIDVNENVSIKAGSSNIELSQDGTVSLGGAGVSKRIITEDDICVGVAPSGGGPIACNFKAPAGPLFPVINNQKVVIK